jgi:hypothetical protein
VLTAEFPAFFLVNVYVPNSGDGLKRLDYRLNQWDKGGCEWVRAGAGWGCVQGRLPAAAAARQWRRRS